MVDSRSEYDENKSRANKVKHGIDFEESQALWLDPDATAVPADFDGEPRYLVIGAIAGNLWTAIVTERGDRIRIISVRRARLKEARQHGNRQDHR